MTNVERVLELLERAIGMSISISVSNKYSFFKSEFELQKLTTNSESIIFHSNKIKQDFFVDIEQIKEFGFNCPDTSANIVLTTEDYTYLHFYL